MARHGYHLFETEVGLCGIAWSDRGVTRFQLPEEDEAATRRRLVKGLTDAEEAAPPAPIADVVDRVQALLRGEPADFSDTALDLEGVPPFHRRVYDIALTIPPGRTLTYGEIAKALGEPGAAQAVGQALGRNPIPVIVPCHRVLGAGGWTGGFSAGDGVATKLKLLAIEGLDLRPPPGLFD
jgi:methylated-DNA-[protein]-cysteine S-methyltransferase